MAQRQQRSPDRLRQRCLGWCHNGLCPPHTLPSAQFRGGCCARKETASICDDAGCPGPQARDASGRPGEVRVFGARAVALNLTVDVYSQNSRLGGSGPLAIWLPGGARDIRVGKFTLPESVPYEVVIEYYDSEGNAYRTRRSSPWLASRRSPSKFTASTLAGLRSSSRAQPWPHCPPSARPYLAPLAETRPRLGERFGTLDGTLAVTGSWPPTRK
jgi:hypothetical protein